MNLKIFQIGTPVLRQKARPLTMEEIISPEIQQLIELMRDTMRDAPGVGLAAPQIGVGVQLVMIEDLAAYQARLTPEQLKERERVPLPFHILINPSITIENNGEVEFYEGCLSISGLIGQIKRAKSVSVKALNEKGESLEIHATGWYARILQHEIDHLQGILCVDRMKISSLTTLENYQRYIL